MIAYIIFIYHSFFAYLFVDVLFIGYRYRVRGFLLYVDHADVTAQGTYHCIIVRPNDVIETSDALLGKSHRETRTWSSLHY